MSDRLSFQLDMTGEMADHLRPVVSQLKATGDAMETVRVDAGYLGEALGKASAKIRESGGSLKEQTTLLKAYRELQRGGAGQSAFGGSALGSVLGDLADKPVKAAIPPVKALQLEWGNMFKSFAGLRREVGDDGKATWIFNVADGLRAIGGAAQWAIGHVLALTGSMIRAGAAESDLRVAEKFTGAGAQNRRLGEDLSVNTRFDDDVGRRSLLPFRRAGIKDEGTLSHLLTAAGDVEAMTAGETQFREAMGAFQRIAIKRDLNDRLLESLGLNADDAFKNLGDLLGVSAKQAKEQAGQGKIASDTLISVVLDELAKKQGGSLGGASLEAGKTLGASVQRLSDLSDNVWKNFADTPGAQRLTDAINAFVATMTGPTGARVMERLAGALETFVGAADAFARYFADPASASHEGALAGQTKMQGPGGLALNISGDNQADLLERAGVPWWGRAANALAIAQPYYKDIALRQAQSEMGGAPQAHDFMWRGGDVVKLDPEDTIIGAKGAAGDRLAGGSGGGDTFHIFVQAHGAGAQELGDALEERLELIMDRRGRRAALAAGTA